MGTAGAGIVRIYLDDKKKKLIILGWVGIGVGLGWVGLGWVGLGWVGLGLGLGLGLGGD